MKIRCDVCDKEEASVFCPSDEAALCAPCDRQIHRANKLASQHNRFSLLHSSASASAAATSEPLCDICQIRRAFLFCREDRAILCRECDIPIHDTSEHTQKHSRFLLTGVKVSPSPATSSSCSSSVASSGEENEGSLKKCSRKRSKMGFSKGLVISEYLESLPGWCVEEFLDSSSSPHLFL
ncbi:B-box zinc finger protein 21 [Cucumis sativus]|uniref:B box-type domain-containing protein n=1 Tax=Cucumis sativus TaxID=3659 RepID=A0A0A0LIV6_CUCSA|nr:B-box zinc finger protein 21 [Cucumis sativus]KGN61840.1 hypothetical protein Csa_006438 [Cucumis sativus]